MHIIGKIYLLLKITAQLRSVLPLVSGKIKAMNMLLNGLFWAACVERGGHFMSRKPTTFRASTSCPMTNTER